MSDSKSGSASSQQASASSGRLSKAKKPFQDEQAQAVSLRVNDLFGVAGKTALVTGGSRGIGFMAARGLVENGAKVYVCSRSQSQCDEAAAELNRLGKGSAVSLPGDLGSPEGCKAVADKLKTLEKRLDILVNNAGATWAAPFESYPAEAWDRVMRLNVVAAFILTQQLLPLLIVSGKDGREELKEDRPNPARVINISSVAGIRPAMTDGAGAFAYTTSKAAVNHLTEALCRVLSPHNITVNAIAPGMFPSNMTKFVFSDDSAKQALGMLNPFGRAGRTSDIAGAILFLSSTAANWVSGVVLPLDGGQYLHDSKLL